MTGQPALALPMGHSTDGLPLGVQLVGPPAADAAPLALAAQLEQATTASPVRRTASVVPLGDP